MGSSAYSAKVMAHCQVAEVENLGGVAGAAEVAQIVGGDEVPRASGEEGSVGGTNDLEDRGASDNENSWTYNFVASTITLGCI
jgi:hypothetical protein